MHAPAASGLARGPGDRQPGPRPSQDPCGLHRCTRRLARVGMASACCREGQARVQARRGRWSARQRTDRRPSQPRAWKPAPVGMAAHSLPPASPVRMGAGCGAPGPEAPAGLSPVHRPEPRSGWHPGSLLAHCAARACALTRQHPKGGCPPNGPFRPRMGAGDRHKLIVEPCETVSARTQARVRPTSDLGMRSSSIGVRAGASERASRTLAGRPAPHQAPTPPMWRARSLRWRLRGPCAGSGTTGNGSGTSPAAAA